MILADSKSVGDDTLERLTAAPIRTIMQRLAVLLKPSGAHGAAAPAAHAAVPLEPEEVAMGLEAAETGEVLGLRDAQQAPEGAEPPEAPEDPEPVAALAAELELALVPEAEDAQPPAPPAAAPPTDNLDTITAAEIANILELELTIEDVRPAPAAKSAPAAASEVGVADSGMLRLEFLAEPPVVQPAANPSAVAKNLQAASKAAEVAPTRGPRPLPAPVVRASAPAAKGNAPAPAPKAHPRGRFEPVPAHSRLTLHASEDVVVLFDSDPAQTPARAAPAKAPPAPEKSSAPPAKPAAAPTRLTAARTASAVRAPATARPAPAAPVAAPVASAPPPPLDLVPFAKLRAGGQTRRFQVQPRAPASQRDPAALDEQTVQQLLAWLGAHRALWNGVPTSFTVNLSIATLEDERFLTRVSAALNTHGIAAETLGFEIAESLCGQQRAKVERFFAQCENLGVWIAIDDFSFDSQVLPLLRSKALRMLKLDPRLTTAALRDKLSQALVVATVQAAKVLGIHCSAKKADSHASLQYLGAIGLDYAQGASLSRTVPIEAIARVPDSRSSGMPALENNE